MADSKQNGGFPPDEPNRTIMVKAQSHDRIGAIRELFISGHAEDVLSPALAECAKAGREISRDSWPRWLVLEIALRGFQEALERDLAEKKPGDL